MHRALLFLGFLFASPSFAQSLPPAPEVIATVIRQASGLEAVDEVGAPLPQGSVTGFVTRLVYELGVTAPQSDDAYSFGVGCQASDRPGQWSCQIVLAIHWSDAESAFSAMFDLVQGDASQCPDQPLDHHGPYNPCAWAVAENRITLMFAG